MVMQGFAGAIEPAAKQDAAAKERHVYLFKDGVLTEDGEPIK